MMGTAHSVGAPSSRGYWRWLARPRSHELSINQRNIVNPSAPSGSLRLPFTDLLISVSPHYYPRQVRVRQHHARPRTIFTADIMDARGITGILIIIHIHDTIDVPHPRDTKDILTWPT